MRCHGRRSAHQNFRFPAEISASPRCDSPERRARGELYRTKHQQKPAAQDHIGGRRRSRHWRFRSGKRISGCALRRSGPNRINRIACANIASGLARRTRSGNICSRIGIQPDARSCRGSSDRLMTVLTVDAIRRCLDGDLPATIATCAPDGTANVTMLSQVQYVDSEHVALSYQFFNKTRQNILANPFASVDVIHPVTAATYQLSLHYLSTETSGAVFENMKAKLAGIASHTGMQGIFRLLGADIYHVSAIRAVPGDVLPEAPRASLLSATRICCEHLASASETSAMLDQLLADLRQQFGIDH